MRTLGPQEVELVQAQALALYVSKFLEAETRVLGCCRVAATLEVGL